MFNIFIIKENYKKLRENIYIILLNNLYVLFIFCMEVKILKVEWGNVEGYFFFIIIFLLVVNFCVKSR